MSRYQVEALDKEKHECVIGWDSIKSTYFAIISNKQVPGFGNNNTFQEVQSTDLSSVINEIEVWIEPIGDVTIATLIGDKVRQKHAELFESTYAQEFNKLDKKYISLKKEDAEKGEPVELSELSSIDKPISHQSDYERAIDMLETTTDEQVLMNGQEYDTYMLDNWNWKRDLNFTKDSILSNTIRYTR